MQVLLEDISESRFTSSTIRRMWQCVDSAKQDPKWQELVYGVLNRNLRGRWKDYAAEVGVLLDWARSVVDYRRDPAGLELVQDPWRTLSIRRADCDDFVVLLAAAIETAVGAPTRFVTVSTKPDRQWSHVYLETFLDGRWTAVDAIVQWAAVGWEPTENVTAKKIWTRKTVGLAGDDDLPLEGLGMLSLNGHRKWEGGFASAMFAPDFGIANDVAKTWADGAPGDAFRTDRVIESKDVAELADPVQQPRVGNGTYPAQYAIESWRSGYEMGVPIDMSKVPMAFDPSLWTGAVPDAVEDWRAVLPQKIASEMQSMTDLTGLGDVSTAIARDASSIAGSIISLVNTGELPKDSNIIKDAINLGVQIWAKERAPDIEEAKAREAEARARQAAAEAEILRQRQMLEEGVPIYKKPWFFPVVGAAAIFLFKGGAALFGDGRKKYRSNPKRGKGFGIGGLKRYLPYAAVGGAAYWLISRKRSPVRAAAAAAASSPIPTAEPMTMVTQRELEEAMR